LQILFEPCGVSVYDYLSLIGQPHHVSRVQSPCFGRFYGKFSKDALVNLFGIPTGIKTQCGFEGVPKLLEACDATTDLWLSFQQANVNAACCQQGRDGQTANAAANDHDLMSHTFT
jgi:hypothetical protein